MSDTSDNESACSGESTKPNPEELSVFHRAFSSSLGVIKQPSKGGMYARNQAVFERRYVCAFVRLAPVSVCMLGA
jgi:hypothetical protein